jgi:hypothetical protein
MLVAFPNIFYAHNNSINYNFQFIYYITKFN